MKVNQGFDEVMIVNPHDPRFDTAQGVRLMRFHYPQAPGMGYYAAPDPYGYGYYGQDPYLAEEYPYGVGDPYGYYGYYAQPPQVAPYAGPAFYGQAPYEPGYGQIEPQPVGYYAEDPYGPMGEPPEPGYYGQAPYEPGYGQIEPQPVGYYAEDPYGTMGEPPEPGYYGQAPYEPGYGQIEPQPVGYYAEDPYGTMGEPQEPGYYGQVPEMVGYGEYAPPEPGYSGVGYYGEPDLTGYVRDIEPTFNPGCPLPTNVAGFGEPETLDGYIKPTTVNPICPEFTPQPGPTPTVPESFKPIW